LTNIDLQATVDYLLLWLGATSISNRVIVFVVLSV